MLLTIGSLGIISVWGLERLDSDSNELPEVPGLVELYPTSTTALLSLTSPLIALATRREKCMEFQICGRICSWLSQTSCAVP
jgi:hypothetical protein